MGQGLRWARQHSAQCHPALLPKETQSPRASQPRALSSHQFDLRPQRIVRNRAHSWWRPRRQLQVWPTQPALLRLLPLLPSRRLLRQAHQRACLEEPRLVSPSVSWWESVRSSWASCLYTAARRTRRRRSRTMRRCLCIMRPLHHLHRCSSLPLQPLQAYELSAPRPPRPVSV